MPLTRRAAVQSLGAMLIGGWWCVRNAGGLWVPERRKLFAAPRPRMVSWDMIRSWETFREGRPYRANVEDYYERHPALAVWARWSNGGQGIYVLDTGLLRNQSPGFQEWRRHGVISGPGHQLRVSPAVLALAPETVALGVDTRQALTDLYTPGPRRLR